MSADDVVIRVQELTIGYDRILLEHVSFEVRRGEVFGILGRSGAGKSALLRHLIGLEPPWTGHVWIEGLGEPRLRVDERPRFGVLFEGGALLGSLTLRENLALPLRTWTALDEAAIDALVTAKLRMIGLAGDEDRLPGELSSGMRKRASIARAQMLEPTLMFLDEPTAGLDPVTAEEIDELILTLNRNLGTTLVIVTHDLASILRTVTRCILLDDETRSIVAEGDPRRLRVASTDPRVHDFFHRLAGRVP